MRKVEKGPRNSRPTPSRPLGYPQATIPDTEFRTGVRGWEERGARARARKRGVEGGGSVLRRRKGGVGDRREKRVILAEAEVGDWEELR